MKRLQKVNINTPEHYIQVWKNKQENRPYYDAVRIRALIKHVESGSRVLDVGAGLYGACQYIAERTEIKATLVALDFSEYALNELKKTAPEVDCVVADVYKMPFPDNDFDDVIAGEIIEHMDDVKAFVKELARVCRGTITLTTVDTESEAAKLHGVYPEHIWEFTANDLVKLFKPYGETNHSLVGNYHFVECNTKKRHHEKKV